MWLQLDASREETRNISYGSSCKYNNSSCNYNNTRIFYGKDIKNIFEPTQQLHEGQLTLR